MTLRPIFLVTFLTGCASMIVTSEYANRYFQREYFRRSELPKSRIYFDVGFASDSQCDSIKGSQKYGKYPPIHNSEAFLKNESLIQTHSDFTNGLNACLDKSLRKEYRPSAVHTITATESTLNDGSDTLVKIFSNDTIKYAIPSESRRGNYKKDGDFYLSLRFAKLSGEAHYGKEGSTLITNRRQVTIISTFEYLLYDLKRDTSVAGGRINIKNSLTQPYPVTESVCQDLWREISAKMYANEVK